MDGFDPGTADTFVTRALGIADGVCRRFAAGIPGPNCMAAVTDRVDGGRQLHEGSVSTRVSTRAAVTGVIPAPTTGAVVLQHPFVDEIFYMGTGVQQVWVSVILQLQAAACGLLTQRRLQQIEQVAAVRLQAVARGLLARRQLQEMRRQMRNQEAALAVVAFDAQGQDLDPFDGLQQLHRPAAVPEGVHGVFPTDGVLQL
jgi:hypothetical protein